MSISKISVALCTYNGSSYIKQQLESILNQCVPADEIIICDDRSTDNTVSIIREFQKNTSANISLFINETTLRVLKNFEKALSLCTGDIIFLADQDDIWELKKVEKIKTYFELNQDKNVVFTNAFLLENGKRSGETAWHKRTFTGLLKERSMNPSAMLELLLMNRNVATGATMALRRNALKNYLPFPFFEHHLHDHLLVLMAAAENKLGFIDECLITYRLHKDQQIGFRKRTVPFYIWPAYRLAQIIKKAALKNKRLRQKQLIADYLKKFAVNFPQGLTFLKSV